MGTLTFERAELVAGALRPGNRADRIARWYGSDPLWQLAQERGLADQHHGDVIRRLGADLWLQHAPGWLEYRHTGLVVPGRTDLVPVTVRFYEQPPYDTYGQHPRNYPRVFADPGAASKHRMPDDALCLYYPWHPPERRWTAPDGLLALLNLIRDHLFFELHWRRTLCETGVGEWLGAEEPHGAPGRR